MENLTVRQLAEKLDIQEASLARKLKRWNEKGVIQQTYGINDPLPVEIIELVQSENNLTTTTTTRKVIEETTTSSSSAARKEVQIRHSEPNPTPPPVVAHTPVQAEQKKPKLYTAAAIMLVSTDAVSCGWIAWNSFQEFQLVAAIFFGLSGMAIGYAAIRIIIAGQRNADSYAWGFGIFQVGLHLCAMKVLGDEWSYFTGKIMIAFSLAIATNAIAEAIKVDINKK